ncbi:MAG: hypothetical protein KJ607_02375 [Bacteroidetes bacterium]|nr:hypothetical protein [Bacteroidota bacterium]
MSLLDTLPSVELAYRQAGSKIQSGCLSAPAYAGTADRCSAQAGIGNRYGHNSFFQHSKT